MLVDILTGSLHLPQPSLFVQSLLFDLCVEVNRVGGHALPQPTLQELLQACLDQALQHYQSLTQRVPRVTHKSNSLPQSSQNDDTGFGNFKSLMIKWASAFRKVHFQWLKTEHCSWCLTFVIFTPLCLQIWMKARLPNPVKTTGNKSRVGVKGNIHMNINCSVHTKYWNTFFKKPKGTLTSNLTLLGSSGSGTGRIKS